MFAPGHLGELTQLLTKIWAEPVASGGTRICFALPLEQPAMMLIVLTKNVMPEIIGSVTDRNRSQRPAPSTHQAAPAVSPHPIR